MKLTEEQRELIALIPKAIRKSKEYTDATKLVLGQIDFMHGTDFAEVNGYVFCSNDKMSEETGVSVSQVKRVVKILVNEGLITTQRGDRTKEGKEASKYWLTDLYYELANRPKPKNEPLIGGQNEIEEKNEPLDIDIEIEPELEIIQGTIVHVPEDKNENTMNDMKYNDEFITENDRDAWEIFSMDDDFDYTQYSDIAEMVKRDAGSSKCNENKNKSMYDERNAWITRLFERLDSTLNLLSQCYDKSLVAGKDGYGDTLKRLFQSGDSKVETGWFTEKQLYKYQGYINRYNGLMRDRRDRFNVKDTMTASNENSIISTGLSESVEGGGCAAPRFTNEEYLNALKKVFIEDLGWSLSTFYSRMGYGMYDYRKKVADILGVNVDRIDGYKFEKDIKAILPNDMIVEEPMVAYGNNSVKEAQEQFAMALAANG